MRLCDPYASSMYVTGDQMTGEGLNGVLPRR